MIDCGDDALLLAIAGDAPALDEAGAVLAAHGVAVDVVGRDGPDRAHHLALLVAHGVGVERRPAAPSRPGRGAAACGSGSCRAARRTRRSSAPRASTPMLSADGDLHVVDVIAGSRAARRCRCRSGRPGCSGRSPCRGSGRSGRPGPRAHAAATTWLSARDEARSRPNGFSMTMRTQPWLPSGSGSAPPRRAARPGAGRATGASTRRRADCRPCRARARRRDTGDPGRGRSRRRRGRRSGRRGPARSGPTPGTGRLHAREVGDGLAHEGAELLVVHLVRPTPTTAKGSGSTRPWNIDHSAGTSFRRVRSPEAPKITRTQESSADVACHRDFPLRAAASPSA